MRISPHNAFYRSEQLWNSRSQSGLKSDFSELLEKLEYCKLEHDRIEVIRSINYCIKRIEDWSFWQHAENMKCDDLRKFQYEWFQYLVTDSSSINYYFQTKVINSEPIDREKELKYLLFEDDCYNKVSNFLSEKGHIDKKGHLYIKFSVNWFLSRYNLATAFRLIFLARKDNAKKTLMKSLESILFSASGPFLIFLVLFLVLILVPFFITKSGMIQGRGSCFDVDLSCFFDMSRMFSWQVDSYWQFAHTWGIQFILIGVLIIIVFIIVGNVLVLSDFSFYKLLLPRLLGGITLGYIPLAMTDEIWRWLFEFNEAVLALMAFVATVTSGAYLFLEVYNNIANVAEARKRAITVLSYGLFYSLTMGIFLFDFFSPVYVEALVKGEESLNTPIFIEGIFGFYDPMRVLAYFPIALTIGIFLQIFWEDKPITYPI